MAALGNADRTINGTVTELIGTANNDTISLTGSFLLSGTTSGLIDGGSDADELRIGSGANLQGTNIAGIESTVLNQSSFATVDGGEINDLGAISIDTADSDGRGLLRLSNIDGETADFGDLTLAANEELEFLTTGALVGQSFTADFSGATFAAGSFIDYNGGNANESITGGSGDDELSGQSGNDILVGGDGDDILDGGSGENTLTGGTGNDTLSSTGGGGLDGGTGDDQITVSGTSNESMISGGGGEDVISTNGLGINSTLDAGAGNDTISVTSTFQSGVLDGGSDADELRIGSGANLQGTNIAGIESTVLNQSSFATVDGGEINDLGAISIDSADFDGRALLQLSNINGSNANFGDLTLDVNEELQLQTIGASIGQSFTADFSGATFAAGSFIDYNGGNANESITGGSGDDELSGQSGDDILVGGDGDDILDGGSGENTLTGGTGNDTLSSTGGGGLDGGTGDDQITVSGTSSLSVISGGAGEDIISTNGLGNDSTLDAGAGNDTISVSSTFQSGVLDGGSDTDELRIGSGANLQGTNITGIESTVLNQLSFATVNGGEINDLGAISIDTADIDGRGLLRLANIDGETADFGDLTLDVNEELEFLTTGASTGHSFVADFSGATFAAGSFIDYNGGNANETITGGSGDDELSGQNGDDILVGGDGDDILDGGSGENTLTGGTGNDTLSSTGGGGLDGGTGDDQITVSGTSNESMISGGAGEDIISTNGLGNDSTLDAGADDDTISVLGSFRSGDLDGGLGVDELRIGSGANLQGTNIAGIESTVLNQSSFATVDGGEINDLGAISIDSADFDGRALLQLSNINGSNANFGDLTLDVNEELQLQTIGASIGQSFTADFSGATFAAGSFIDYNGGNANESITGGSGDDELSGQSGDDILVGGDGDDILDGGSGDDLLVAGTGADELNGGGGDDRIELGASDDTYGSFVAYNAYLVRESGSVLFVRVNGKNQTDDVIDGGSGTDEVVGTAGDDVLFKTSTQSGAAGGDNSVDRLVAVEEFFLGDGNDVLDLTSRDGDHYETDVMADGGAGNDRVWGGDGDDILIGGDGADFIVGGAGDDILTGSDGSSGDGLRDIFGFGDHADAGTDVITDFMDGEDRIFLVGFGITDVSDADLDIDFDAGTGDSTITASDDFTTIITVENIDATLFTNADFAFWA